MGFLTKPSGAFADSEDLSGRRRNEAINQLRRAGSPLARVARERTFRTGQKGSTFPWANTATALFEEIGTCWLVTEIAILGAASPHALGYVKKPGLSAFGKDGHPAELLAQTRNSAADLGWWTQQREHLKDDLDRASWALAIWGVAVGPVIDALFDEWAATVGSLSVSQRRAVLRSCRLIADSGWLARRPVTVDTTERDLQELLNLRSGSPHRAAGLIENSPTFTGSHPDVPSLLSVARAEKWLKVDSQPSYK